jgi:hypothetical protein
MQFGFHPRATDGKLTGTVTFPLGIGSFRDGSIDGNRVTFVTQHQMKSSGRTIITTFDGERSGSTLELIMHSEGTESRLSARRVLR